MSAGNYSTVDNGLWKHRAFTRELTDDEKLVFLYMKTCHLSNMIGCFHLPMIYICEGLNWAGNGYDNGLERVTQTLPKLFRNGFARVDLDHEIVFLPKHLLKHPPQNPNQVKAAEKLITQLPSGFKYLDDLQRVFYSLERVKELLPNGYPNRSETVTTTVTELFPPETETETETITIGETSSPRLDVDDLIWKVGIELIGGKEQTTRALLGKMAKDHGKENLADAIEKTIIDSPVDPKAYIIGVLKNGKDQSNGRTKNLSAAERATLASQKWAERQQPGRGNR